MSKFRGVDTKPFELAAGKMPEREPGAAPMLKWIKITDLKIDPSYQRTIEGTGSKNIIKIARDFDWTKFSTVIVAPIEGGLFAIVDGQHRTTAAALRGIEKVPCQVIVADRRQQAAAFAAVNSVLTAMSSMQVHAARVVAGDPQAVLLNKICAEAGVTICRYPIPANKMKVGETLAAGQLTKFLDKFGAEILKTALSCITRTRDGYPGLLRAPLINAFCVVLEAEPDWLESPKLLKAIRSIDLREFFDKALSEARMSRAGFVSLLVDKLSEYLEDQLTPRAA